MKNKIEFEPIKQRGGGLIHLSIYPPKTFNGNIKDYLVMVGGSGVGHKDTLKEAKLHLLHCAAEQCQKYIDDATDAPSAAYEIEQMLLKKYNTK